MHWAACFGIQLELRNNKSTREMNNNKNVSRTHTVYTYMYLHQHNQMGKNSYNLLDVPNLINFEFDSNTKEEKKNTNGLKSA